MKKYLGSGLVKGIGPVNAGRIVDAFGEATFEIIDDDPNRLTEVAGIGPIRASRIAATWAEQRHIREVMAASRATASRPRWRCGSTRSSGTRAARSSPRSRIAWHARSGG